MLLFAILFLILLFLVVFVAFIVSVGGAMFTIVFSDVIVCIAIIALIIRFLWKRKRRG